MKFRIYVSIFYRYYIPNLVKIDAAVLEKKMLTDDERQPIAIASHLSDSDDLNILMTISSIFGGNWPRSSGEA